MIWDGNAVYWRGEPSYQLPSDLLRYQEIIFSTMPDWIIETGGGAGTTWFLSDVCNLIEYGRVYPVKEDSLRNVPRLEGSVMAILDSDVYSEEHMAAEIRAYAPLVSRGYYLVVCHTDRSDWGAAPALEAYLKSNPQLFVRQTVASPSLCTYLVRR